MTERIIENPAAGQHPTGAKWTEDMKQRLIAEYPDARAEGKLRDLATALGVELYELYNKAHRLGLSKQIRRR